MDIQEKIQLGKYKSVDSVNVDTTIKIGLSSKNELNIEYNVQNILDITQVYENERQSTTTYRIHGEIEYLSILNGLKVDYTTLTDFFSLKDNTLENKSIFTDLKIYLVRPASEFTELIINRNYIRNYEVISSINDIDIIPAGFSKNIFNEQQYSFIVNTDINIGDLVDGLGFPITELYLYIEYQPKINGNNIPETMEKKTYDIQGNTIIEDFIPSGLSKGDIIEGDAITYNKEEFLQTNKNLQEHYLYTSYNVSLAPQKLKWKYKPFIPIKLRYFENEVQKVNTGTTAYEDLIKIPTYATPLDNDNYVWRNILDNGFFDPIDEIGVSFPFINQKHYVFENIIFNVQPDLSDNNTNLVFNKIKFNENILDSVTPNSNLNKVGDICN